MATFSSTTRASCRASAARSRDSAATDHGRGSRLQSSTSDVYIVARDDGINKQNEVRVVVGVVVAVFVVML